MTRNDDSIRELTDPADDERKLESWKAVLRAAEVADAEDDLRPSFRVALRDRVMAEASARHRPRWRRWLLGSAGAGVMATAVAAGLLFVLKPEPQMAARAPSSVSADDASADPADPTPKAAPVPAVESTPAVPAPVVPESPPKATAPLERRATRRKRRAAPRVRTDESPAARRSATPPEVSSDDTMGAIGSGAGETGFSAVEPKGSVNGGGSVDKAALRARAEAPTSRSEEDRDGAAWEAALTEGRELRIQRRWPASEARLDRARRLAPDLNAKARVWLELAELELARSRAGAAEAWAAKAMSSPEARVRTRATEISRRARSQRRDADVP